MDEEYLKFAKNGQWVLEKGSRQRQMPFNPTKALSEPEKASIANWQHGALTGEKDVFGNPVKDQSAKYREEIPYMAPEVRKRALHKLTAKTKSRKNPETGDLEFLLHRGMSGKEKKKVVFADEVSHPVRSSWTSDYDLAHHFATEAYGYSRGPVSAWIPAKHIVSIPNQYGNTPDTHLATSHPELAPKKIGKNHFNNEHEVILDPHSSHLASWEDMAHLTRPHSKLDNRVNMPSTVQFYGNNPKVQAIVDAQREKKLK